MPLCCFSAVLLFLIGGDLRGTATCENIETQLVPIDVRLYDDEGNPIDRDNLAKVVDGDLVLYFKICRTMVVVRFDEENQVKHCYEHFDIR